MLTPASQLMPSLLQVVNPQSMTISTDDFYDAPCLERCGELIPTHWDEVRAVWVYDRPCYTCSEKQNGIGRKRLALQYSGLTETESTLTLDTVIVTEDNVDALEAAKRLAKGEPLNLFLHGPAGRGKSRLAIGVVLERLGHVKAKFIPVTKTLMLVRGNMKEMSEDDVIEKLVSCGVLALDDFGANKLTEWNLSFLDCLIDEWYRERKSGLIVTSNFSLREVAERISDRIASRLAFLCEVYQLGGKDWRLSK